MWGWRSAQNQHHFSHTNPSILLPAVAETMLAVNALCFKKRLIIWMQTRPKKQVGDREPRPWSDIWYKTMSLVTWISECNSNVCESQLNTLIRHWRLGMGTIDWKISLNFSRDMLFYIGSGIFLWEDQIFYNVSPDLDWVVLFVQGRSIPFGLGFETSGLVVVTWAIAWIGRVWFSFLLKLGSFCQEGPIGLARTPEEWLLFALPP